MELHARKVVAEDLGVGVVPLVVAAAPPHVAASPGGPALLSRTALLVLLVLVLVVGELLIEALLHGLKPRIDRLLGLLEALAEILLDDGQVVVDEAAFGLLLVLSPAPAAAAAEDPARVQPRLLAGRAAAGALLVRTDVLVVLRELARVQLVGLKLRLRRRPRDGGRSRW